MEVKIINSLATDEAYLNIIIFFKLYFPVFSLILYHCLSFPKTTPVYVHSVVYIPILCFHGGHLINIFLCFSHPQRNNYHHPLTTSIPTLKNKAVFMALYFNIIMFLSYSNNASWRKQERYLHTKQTTKSFSSSHTKTLLGISWWTG